MRAVARARGQREPAKNVDAGDAPGHRTAAPATSPRAKVQAGAAARRRDAHAAATRARLQFGVAAPARRKGAREPKKTPAQLVAEIKTRVNARRAPLDLPPGAAG